MDTSKSQIEVSENFCTHKKIVFHVTTVSKSVLTNLTTPKKCSLQPGKKIRHNKKCKCLPNVDQIDSRFKQISRESLNSVRPVSNTHIGGILIICDTPGGRGWVCQTVNKNHMGEEGCQQKCHVTFLFVISPVKVNKSLCHVTQRSVEGGRGSKKCHVLFEWPLMAFSKSILV